MGLSDEGVNTQVEAWLESQAKQSAAQGDLAIIGVSGGLRPVDGDVFLAVVYQLVPRSGGLLVPGRGAANRGGAN